MKRTEQTLVEQMKISDLEIEKRKKLLNLTAEDQKLLTDMKLYISENVDDIVTKFYNEQTQVDEISLLIGDADTLRRLQNALRKYILDLFSGYYDNEYVNNRLRIGLVHKRIGVEPKLYLSAVMMLKQYLFESLNNFISDMQVFSKTYAALDRLLYFDITLVFDTYIDSLIGEIETERQKTEVYAKSLEEKVVQRTKQLEELSRIDPLTNIYNQRAMYEYLRHALASAKREDTVVTIIYFDVDKFKKINDLEGHVKGDEVLKYIGQILKTEIREIDISCRYGGDEFMIILGKTDLENSRLICERIIDSFLQKYPDYSLSVGIAQTGPTNYVDSDKLIKMADEKMYLAKKEPGCQVRY